MVIDTFLYNGETALLKLHLGILYDYVDKFIIVEANKTFTGTKKPMHFFRDQRYFAQWHKKIEYYPMTDWDDVRIWDQAFTSQNTTGADHWKREFYIKESILKALEFSNVKDDDVLFIGDVDEIIDPLASFESESPIKARLRVYTYYLNNRSDEVFYGTLIGQYSDIKGRCLNHMRSDTNLYSQGDHLGWHFTSMGGTEKVREKLNDQYTEESYNTRDVQLNLAARIASNTDFLGRSFQYSLDESEWPLYLRKNRANFEKLLK